MSWKSKIFLTGYRKCPVKAYYPAGEWNVEDES
jgi:hypothetical protein